MVFTRPKLGINIEETNAGIGIPTSMISVRYRNKKNAGLHQLSPVLDWFRHRLFFSFQYRTDRMPDSPAFRHFEI
jgi:hypothetical protein